MKNYHFIFKTLPTIAIFVVLTLIIYGRVAAKEGEMMKSVELSGTYYEIGEKWGKSLKKEIQKSLEIEIHGLAAFISMEKESLIQLAAKFIPMTKEFDPEFMEVLEGIAKGSGQTVEEIFALRSLLELMFYFHKIPAMCTSFAVTSPATADGSTIIGQNIDFHAGLPMSLLKITWPNGVRQLGLTLGGCIWEYTLNVHPSFSPFAMASNLTVSMTEEQELMKVPISIIMNKVGRQKRLEQALSVLIHSQQNLAGFVLASGEGDIIGIENAANQYEVLYPEENIMVRANHYLSDRFKPMDFFAPFVPDSYLRYSRLKQLITREKGKITAEIMMEKLGDHNNFPKAICSHIDKDSKYPPSQTLASIIMVPEKKCVYIASGQPCKSKFVKYIME